MNPNQECDVASYDDEKNFCLYEQTGELIKKYSIHIMSFFVSVAAFPGQTIYSTELV